MEARGLAGEAAATLPEMPGSFQRRAPDHRWLGMAALAVAAVALGLAAGLAPTIAIAGMLGLVIGGIALFNITAGLLVFVAVGFLEAFPGVPAGTSVAKLIGVFLLVGWLISIALRPAGRRANRGLLTDYRLLAFALGAFLAWTLFSLLWAESMAQTEQTVIRFALTFTLFPIVFAAVRTRRHVILVYTTFVVGALVVAAVGRESQEAAIGADRLTGAGLNPNALGSILAVATILGAALACCGGLRTSARVAALGASALCASSVVLTQSRGATLGLAVAAAATPFLAGPGRRGKALALFGVAALTAVVWLSAFAPEQAVQRLTTQDSSGSGRSDLWTIALRMVDDKPITGVGGGNFTAASHRYLLEPGSIVKDEYIIDLPQETHNVYLQVLSELGAVGLFLYGLVIVLCLSYCLRAARAFARSGDRDMEILTRGLLVALVGLLTALFFSSQIFSKPLYLLLALAPVVLTISTRASSDTPT